MSTDSFDDESEERFVRPTIRCRWLLPPLSPLLVVAYGSIELLFTSNDECIETFAKGGGLVEVGRDSTSKLFAIDDDDETQL